MSDRTTLLFALPGFRVLDVSLEDDGGRRVLVESSAVEGGCPSCGVLSGLIRDRPTSRVKDLPHGPVPLQVWVRKRRFVCVQALCERRSFTETSAQLPARARLTARLRTKISQAVSTTNRAMSEVGKDHGVAWWTVHRVLIAAAADVLGPADPTTVIGIDETRARSVRWLLGEVGWRRTDPWMTSIVDLDPAARGGIIGLAPGRSGACVEGWLALQSSGFRDAVHVVAIDPSAPYAAGIRRALPHARIVLDHFHLVMLANKALTDVRQRVSREEHDRRGRKLDPAWAHRRLLLRAGDTLSPKALTRLRTVLATDDPSGQLSAAWAVKELLRLLHRHLAHADVIAALAVAVPVGATSADVVAVEARKIASERGGQPPQTAEPIRGGGPRVISLTERRLSDPAAVIAGLPPDERPLPSVNAYDELLNPPRTR